MATAIEAKSLSTLITLAANPPARPQTIQLEPLVLYIARVPGSRDVFLSPIKPREKVITAEDVQSSLYYLHVSSADDEILLHSVTSERLQVEERVPELPPRPLDSSQHALPDPVQSGQGRSQHHPLPQLPPYPLNGGPPQMENHVPATQNIHISGQEYHQTSMPSRKPVGGAVSASVGSGAFSVPQRPYLAQRPTMNSVSVGADDVPEVTVIRRNPVNGEQWNVGTITDPPVFETTSDGSRRGSMTSSRIRKSGQPLYLTIMNPGYAKFNSINSEWKQSMSSSSTPLQTTSHDVSNAAITTHPASSFSRRMWLEGSLFEKRAASHRKSLSADQQYQEDSSVRPSSDGRRGSGFSFPSRNGFESEEPSSYLDPPEVRRISLVGDHKRSNTKGYTFISPWEGRCEFSSGTMSNSLKCRHLWQRNSLDSIASAPTIVSELRFNLPGGGPLASEPRRRSPTKLVIDKQTRRSRLLAKFNDKHVSSFDAMPHIEARASSEYVEDTTTPPTTRLDLSLGQELAGGGFAGKQAKLGKLIVEGEGLSMLDLIVTANMALWFRAYEKFQGA